MDLAILKFFNYEISNPAFDIFFAVICDFGIWIWPLAVALPLIIWKGGAKARWMILLAVIAVAIIDPVIYRVIKPMIGRIRPCHLASLDWVRAVDGCGGKFSFPSNHAANLFGLAVVVGSFYKTPRFYIYPLAVLIAVGRVYLGVHYPSDVLAGAVFGAAAGLGVVYSARKLSPERIDKHLIIGKR